MRALLTFKIQKAICQSSLSGDIKHLLMVMALLADGHTGVGTASQATIAQCMGRSDRHVRRLLTELAQVPTGPVRLTRKRRGAAAGRCSDEYQLSVAEPEQLSASDTGTQPEQLSGSGEPKRNSVPVGSSTQPDIHDSRTGHPRHPKRTTVSEDQLLISSLINSSSAKRRRERAPKQSPVEGANDLKLHYVAEFQRTRGVEPNFGKAWGRAMKAFGDLVVAHKLDAAKRIITTALADAYVRRINPWELRDDANKYLGAQPARGRQQVAVQRGADEATADSWGRGEQAQKLLNGL